MHFKNLFAGLFSFIALILFYEILPAQEVTIIETAADGLTIEWRMQEPVISPARDMLSFYQSAEAASPGQVHHPVRLLAIALPAGAQPVFHVLKSEKRRLNGFKAALIPGPPPAEQTNFYSSDLLQFGAGDDFRGFQYIPLLISPLQTSADGETLLYDYLQIRIDFHATGNTIKQSTTGENDLAAGFLVNYRQALPWRQRPAFSMRKVSGDEVQTAWKIPVSNDGLYRLTAQELSTSGHSGVPAVANLQLFNNGGHALSYPTSAEWYNPAYNSEVPVRIYDLDQNGLFDNSDYLIFYGKHSSGWFYESSEKEFRYHQNPYNLENIYLLTTSSPGAARFIAEGDSISGASILSTFTNRYHFEEESYNLLASGPDWYGHRFFGLSGSYSHTFNIDPDLASAENALLRVQFKGGSHIKYGDDATYTYNVSTALNSTPLPNIRYQGTSGTITNPVINMSNAILRLYYRELDPGWLQNGNNTVSFLYEGGSEGSVLHLDWFEVYYPEKFQAEGDQLLFYTPATATGWQISISNLSIRSDFLLLDVSDPTRPVLLEENLQSAGNQLTVTVPPASTPRRYLIVQPQGAAVKTADISGSYTPRQNLLSTAEQAEYLILTQRSFLPYANEIRELRSDLQTMVIDVDDIYHYFNNGIQDPTAIRNFIRYADANWQNVPPEYILLFGDGHYDYRHIQLADTMRIPPFEIFDAGEIDSRTTDFYYTDLQLSTINTLTSIKPDLGIGRLPMESTLDAARMVEKLKLYARNEQATGWQNSIAFVADDGVNSQTSTEYEHEDNSEKLARLSQLSRFNRERIYLSAYPAVPGGLRYLKPQAAQTLLDQINQGALIVNYVGHGSPTQWADESVFVMSRDLRQINNNGRLIFFIAATCDFGKYDDPHDPSFSEALIWKEESGAIGVLASTRLVYSGQNFAFNRRYYENLSPIGQPMRRLGDALVLASIASINDMKYHLFADPTMYLAHARQDIRITNIDDGDLSALSRVSVTGEVLTAGGEPAADFNGSAVLLVHDARFDSIDTINDPERHHYYSKPGPLLFKGEVTVTGGRMSGNFIVPKSIRYHNQPTGRLSLYAREAQNYTLAYGIIDTLTFIGSQNISDSDGPGIDLYFQDQPAFSDGDIIGDQPVLLAGISDENGVNVSNGAGHNLRIRLDDGEPRDVSGFFVYDKDSYTSGLLQYPLTSIGSGEHELELTAFDNVNNPSEKSVRFQVTATEKIIISEVVNFPNPFARETSFTFQTNQSGAEIEIKIYTLSGLIIRRIKGFQTSLGYNSVEWDGRDEDGDALANGVYLYKIILSNGRSRTEVIEKLVVLK